jgi:hypothetical protein
MVRKEFIQMRRDPLTLAMLLVIPAMYLLLFGFAVRTEVRHLPTVVLDESRTAESRRLVSVLEQTQNFRVAGAVADRGALRRAVERGDARAAIVVPPGFARDLKLGRGAQAQVIVDAADPMSSSAALAGAALAARVLPGRARARAAPRRAGRGAARAPVVQPGAPQQHVRGARHHRPAAHHHAARGDGDGRGARARGGDARAARGDARRPGQHDVGQGDPVRGRRVPPDDERARAGRRGVRRARARQPPAALRAERAVHRGQPRARACSSRRCRARRTARSSSPRS